MRFVNPHNDLAFQKIFGSEQHSAILIAFLNALLNRQGDQAIETIRILNPYQTPTVDETSESALHIRATDHSGTTFIVAITLDNSPHALKRLQWYAYKTYAEQDYFDIRPLILIGILDVCIFESDDYLTCHHIYNDKTGAQDLADVAFVFLELPKFTRSEAMLERAQDQWIAFLTHAHTLESIPAYVDSAPLRAAYEAADRTAWSDTELEFYRQQSTNGQDEHEIVATTETHNQDEPAPVAAAEAHNQDEPAPVAPAETHNDTHRHHEMQQEIVRDLLSQGLNAEQIASIIGIPVADVIAEQQRLLGKC